MNTNAQQTISFVAEPVDHRCKWWAMVLPESLDLEGRINAPYLRAGSDLELPIGSMVITSEAMHHNKNRGYLTALRIALETGMEHIRPNMATKQHIKANGGQDLMVGSGDVVGVIRMAIWLRRQPDLAAAVAELKAL
jgi:hypothetical protein